MIQFVGLSSCNEQLFNIYFFSLKRNSICKSNNYTGIFDVSCGMLINVLTLLHSERPKLCTILAFLSVIELRDSDRGFHKIPV